MASTVGTLFQLVPAIPIELIKTKLQTQSMTGPQHRVQCTGPLDCAIKIIRADGLIGLYRGGAVMFWRDLIGYFFYIPAFELFRSELRVMREKYGGSNGRPANDGACELLAGGLAGSLSWWLICPFELVKNRLQRSAPNGQNQQRSWRRVVARLVAQGKSGGGGSGSGINKICGTVGNFYRGGTVLALRAFPVNAVIFFVHSKCSQLF